MPRYAARVDTVQAEIVKGLRQYGIAVEMMGKPADILCHGMYARDGRLTYLRGLMLYIPMELKSDQKTRGYKPELTKAQRKIKMPMPRAHNLAEALAFYGIELT